jgi:hypothetical protein
MVVPAVSTVERAYELARSGQFSCVAAIKKQLKVEGYTSVEPHFCGQALQKTLRQICMGRASQHAHQPSNSAIAAQ